MGICEDCQTETEVTEVMAMTAYPTKLPVRHPDNPNRPMMLCKPCEDDYVEYWTERWDEYRSSQGV